MAPPSRWSKTLERVAADGSPDPLRREALAALAAATGRSTVVYATAFHVPAKGLLGQLMSLVLSDISGFREAIDELPAGPLDLVLHTPGGSAEAAEGVVTLLRSKFSHIRVIVPLAAKSAGTILAMAADEIVMLPGAELGPIDPQFTNLQGRASPARAIEKQFERAVDEISADAKRIPAWVPLIAPLGPSLLEECRNAAALSKGLVSRWLATYMLSDDVERALRAATVANYLSDYGEHLSHSRRIGVDELSPLGVKIRYAHDVEEGLDSLIDDLWLGMEHTLGGSACYKMFENNKGQGLFSQASIEPARAMPPQKA